MAWSTDSGRVLSFAVVVPLLAVAPSPAMVGRDADVRYTVTLAEIEQFDGGVEAATLSCPDIGACIGLVRVEVRGRPYDYLLSAVASDGRLSLIFRGRTPVTPALNHRQGFPIGIPLAPDGTGQRDFTLSALRGSEPRTTVAPRTGTGTGDGWLRPAGTPVANVRVTVRREEAAERSR